MLALRVHGNVVRILSPLVIADAELKAGLEILEEALGGTIG